MTDATTTTSPFDTLEDAFGVLCAGPSPLALDGATVAGLPRRPIPLAELRAILLHPSTSHRTRDAALGVLVARARTEGGRWTVGLAGVLLFGLRRAVSVLCDVCPGKGADIEAEALAGLIEGIAATEPTRRRLASRLIWLARNRAKRLVSRELAEVGRPGHHPVPDAPARPYGHPDLVLAEAVGEGVLCAEDAALIGDTRLGLLTVRQAAAALGLTPDNAYKRRKRAEGQVVEWLLGPEVGGAASQATNHQPPDLRVQNPALTPYLVSGDRPRQGRSTDRRPAACQPPSSTRR